MNAAKPNLKVSLSESMFERIPFDYEKSELTGYSNYSYWHSTFRTFFKQRSSTVLLGIMCAFVAMSLLYPLISELIPGWETSYRNPNFAQTGSAMWNLSPCKEHWFGTDNIGRDMWARTWYGTRTSLLLGFVIAFFDVTLGTIAGALWGYVQRIDRFMTELYNIVTNIPQTVYLVLFTYILRPSFWTIVLAMCLTGWLSIARFVRNRVVAIRENEYNIASQCLGHAALPHSAEKHRAVYRQHRHHGGRADDPLLHRLRGFPQLHQPRPSARRCVARQPCLRRQEQL